MREWLNANAAAGWVAYHAPSETFELNAEQAMVLARYVMYFVKYDLHTSGCYEYRAGLLSPSSVLW